MSRPETTFRLRTYITLLLVAVTTATMALVGGVILLYNLPLIESEARLGVEREAKDRAQLFEFALGGLESQLRPVAALVQNAPADTVTRSLQLLIGQGEQFIAVYVVSPDGIIQSGGFSGARPASVADAVGADLSRNSLFRSAQDGKAVWSDKYMSAQTGGVVIGVALRQGNWTVIGEIAPSYLRQGVSAIAGGGDDKVLVVDRAGEWIAASTDEYGPTDNLGDLPIVRAALSGNDRAEGRELTLHGKVVFAGSARPAKLGWTFIVTRPAGMGNREIRRIVLLTVAGFLGSLLINLLIAPWWARSLSRPLQRMIDRMHRFAEGHYGKIESAGSRINEVNAFDEDLQRMADAIHEREESLARSEERLRATIENSPAVALQWYDRDGICRYWNPSSAALYGYTAEQVLGRGLEARGFTREQCESFVGLLRQVETTGRPIPSVEFVGHHSDGHEIIVLSSIFAIPDARGGQQFVRLDVDITERKRAENALLANRLELESIFNASPVPMSVSDVGTGYRILKVNDAWVRQFGRTAEEVIGRTGGEIGLYDDPEDRLRFLDRLRKGVGIYDDMELWMRRGDGGRLFCRVSARVAEVGGQRLLLMVLEDITEERRMAAELRDMNVELEVRVAQRTEALSQANAELAKALSDLRQAQDYLVRSEKLAALGRLVAGIAHELNTPIGNGLMAVSTLETHHHDFKSAMEGGLRRSTLMNFVDDVGLAARIAGSNLQRAAKLVASFKQVAVDQTSSQRRTFDLKTVVDEMLITLRPTLSRTTHYLEVAIGEGLQLDSYPGPLDQVLANLIENAIKHGFEGRQRGHIRLTGRALPDGMIELVVGDDGVGIPPENLSRIFDPFFTTRLGQGGSGLGLNIAYNLATRILGGTLSVSSAPGRTVFTLVLPRVAPA